LEKAFYKAKQIKPTIFKMLSPKSLNKEKILKGHFKIVGLICLAL
jgi:hypothetical protein